MEKISHRYLISGRVQGVYYRAATMKQAKLLGLTGWVRNLPDGQVEVLAYGNIDQLKQLEAWLWQGPKLARVERVICGAADRQEPEPQDFVVK